MRTLPHMENVNQERASWQRCRVGNVRVPRRTVVRVVQPRPRKWLLGWLGGLACIACCSLAVPDAARAADSSPAVAPAIATPSEAFKAFVANPPSIRELIFRYRKVNMAMEGSLEYDSRRGEVILKPKSTPLSPSWGLDREGFRLYLARYQPGAFVLWQVAPDPVEETPEPFVPKGAFSFGRWGETQWARTRSLVQFATNSQPGPWFTNTNVKGPAIPGERILTEVLNLGVANLNRGRIRWEGNGFTCPSDAVPGVTIRGDAEIENERVTALRLQFNEWPRIVRYSYERPLGVEGIPSRFVVFTKKGGEELFHTEVHILTLATHDPSSEAAAFLPEGGPETIRLGGQPYRLHGAGAVATVVKSNEVTRVFDGTNWAVVHPRTDLVAWGKEEARRGHRWTWAFAWALVGLAPLAAFMILKMKRQRRLNQQVTQ